MSGQMPNILKLVVILIFAGLIGWERERHDRPAGFRTHILVGVGSTLLMIVSIKMVAAFPNSNVDPGRIAAQVVSGIGFLGAGTIIREGFSVKGLTTAASLWAIAAIGLAVGKGFYVLGLTATLIVFITLYFLSNIEMGIIGGIHKKLTCIVEKNNTKIIGKIAGVLSNEKITINNVNVDNENSEKHTTIEFKITITRPNKLHHINPELLKLNGLKELNWIDITDLEKE